VVVVGINVVVVVVVGGKVILIYIKLLQTPLDCTLIVVVPSGALRLVPPVSEDLGTSTRNGVE